MIITFLQRLLWMLALVAMQMLVFNHIHLLGYATPLMSIYLLLLFPLGTKRWTILLWGFVCGLLVDMVSLTLGVCTSAMTLAAFIQPPLLKAIEPQNAAEDMQASFHTLGFWTYVRYAAVMITVFMVTYFLVQAFTFFHLKDIALDFVGSWLLTLVLCLALEATRSRKSSQHAA